VINPEVYCWPLIKFGATVGVALQTTTNVAYRAKKKEEPDVPILKKEKRP